MFDGSDAGGSEFWTSDGTANGTVKLSSSGVDPGSGSSGYAVLGSATLASDFNGDGKSDFLIENTPGSIFMGQVNGGQAGYSPVGALGHEWSFHGDGDFLGDGRADFLIENKSGAVVLGELGPGGQAAYAQVAHPRLGMELPRDGRLSGRRPCGLPHPEQFERRGGRRSRA